MYFASPTYSFSDYVIISGGDNTIEYTEIEGIIAVIIPKQRCDSLGFRLVVGTIMMFLIFCIPALFLFCKRFFYFSYT